MESLFKILGGVFVGFFTAFVSAMGLLLLMPLIALDGWIMHLAWGWFVVPTFGLPALAWAVATGIVQLVSWMTYQLPVGKSEETTTSRLVSGVGVSLISWAMMWIVHLWIIH